MSHLAVLNPIMSHICLRQALASQWAARLVLLWATAFPLGGGRLTLADDLGIVACDDVPKVR